MDQEQLIQDYHASRLTKADQLMVEQLLETDLDFKSEFDDYTTISNAFKISEGKNLKKHLVQLENNLNPSTDKAFKKNKLIYLAIAAGLIIGFFFKIYDGQSGDRLFKSHIDIYPNTYQPITRSTETTDATSAFQAYENNDFKTAALKFETILQSANNPNIQFYYAMSLIHQSKLNLALAELNALNKNSHDFKAESLWYAALIHIQKEDYKNGLRTLEELNTLNSPFKSEERKVLLQKLEDH